ncbi:PIN domain-containing protein [Pollutimonas nitritireducens]|uniref:PIN domain-containing protein n=1 Tax=Pollutimonas nitritireducens TaxID=2045209 RepID=A0A2N4UFL6_9BURK|nr:PIN domain-containing protein [Pollutimonas nitritireducens]PLC53818.1 PIN domain-containing protein [Pollutimonas nitritireducens]
MDKPVLPQILVIDTCVLISNVLRRLLLRLAGQACFQPAWSSIIGDEWQRNASRLWGVSASDIQLQWLELQADFPEADQGEIAPFKAGLRRSDPKDWHVIAAARAAKSRAAAGGAVAGTPVAGASAGIVTRNIKDFNRTELRGYGLTLLDPDEVLVRCLQQFPQQAARAFDEIPDFARTPGKESEALDVILKRERLFRLNRLYPCRP